jgi:hypothetical protein
MPFYFFHPAYFWALAALAVPVLIHFLNRKQSRRLDFSTLRFFSSMAVRTSRVRRIKRMLLLLVRCAVVFVLIALFARPFDKGAVFSVFSNPDASVYASVDPSVSMEYKEGAATLWQKAFSVLDSLDGMLPSSAKRRLYDETRGEFVPVKKYTRLAGPFTRYGENPIEKMMAAFAAAASHETRPAIHVVLSDFQDNVSTVMDTLLNRGRAGPCMLVSVAPRSGWNYSLKNAAVSPEDRSVVAAQVGSQGRELADGRLSVDMGSMRVGHARVRVAKGATASVPVRITTDAAQPLGCLRLEDDDPFLRDNVFYFVQGVSQTVRVLIVGDPAECLPIAAAFSSLGALQWRAVVKQSRDVTYDDVDSASCIVLGGVRQPSSALGLLLRSRAFGQKAIVFSPVVDSGAFFANAAVLPASRRERLSLVADDKPRSPVLPDTLSLLFRGFPKLREADAKVNSYCAGLPGDVLVRLDNGRPFATHLIDTAGNSWIMVATSLCLTGESGVAANTLWQTGLYVPLLDRLCRHALSAIHREPVEWKAGFPRRNPFLGSSHGALVYDAAGRLISQWVGQPQVAFDEPGHFRIQPQQATSYWIAVNIDSAETSCSYRFPQVPKKSRDSVACMESAEFLSFVKNRQTAGVSVWLWIALGLLLCCEALLWERKPGRPPPASS